MNNNLERKNNVCFETTFNNYNNYFMIWLWQWQKFENKKNNLNKADMNFYKIFLNGLSDHFNKIDLKSYCEREFNKAKKEFYTAQSFFEPLLDIILSQRYEINEKTQRDVKDLLENIELAEQNKHTVGDYYSHRLEKYSDEWNEYQRKFNERKLKEFIQDAKDYSIDNIVINDYVTVPLLDEFEKAIRIIYSRENEEAPTPKPFHISDAILKELEKENFIENAKATPIKWLKNKQLLRELLTHENIKNDNSKVVDIENATPVYFINRESKKMKLAKNKVEPSADSDSLKNICDQPTD